MNALTIQVPFHGNNLFIVEHNSEPYTPMKPIVEGMGLDWASQFVKLKANNKRWGITKIVIPTLGDLQEMVCLPLRKIFGWLMTISPNKVKPELKPLIEMYQDECDEVLWRYWNNTLKTDSQQRDVLRNACSKLSPHYGLIGDIYTMVGKHFGYEGGIKDIPTPLLPEAVAFVYEMILRLKTTEPKPAFDDSDKNNIAVLISHSFSLMRWYNHVKNPIMMLNPDLYTASAEHVGMIGMMARSLNKSLDLQVNEKYLLRV